MSEPTRYRSAGNHGAQNSKFPVRPVPHPYLTDSNEAQLLQMDKLIKEKPIHD